MALQGSTLPLRASSPEKTWDEVGELKNSIGIEVDEALRMGGSGFLGESDAGEAELAGCRQNQKASDVIFSTSQRR